MTAVIRIEDIAYVRFGAPDLDEMQCFLNEFGLATRREGDRLYGVARDGWPFAHVTEAGEPCFRALGLRAESVDDLARLAAAEGVPLEDSAAPGGGKLVRLTDPDGYTVEIVAGQRREAVATPTASTVNCAASRERTRQPVRLTPGPATVIRLGHCVLGVSDFRASEAWYKSRFGLLTSDEIEAVPGFAIGAFLRCDRGAQPTDHHTLFLLQGPGGAVFNHAAFEVMGLDDLMLGHDHLAARGRTAAWGVGRHLLGSQIFDYWRDPWGHELEHWTDGDLFTAADGGNTASLADLLGVQWGQPFPGLSGNAGEARA